MPVGLPGMCLPMWRATICAPIDRLPVTRDPTTIVTVLPLKKSACPRAEDGVQDRASETARMLAIDNRLTVPSLACRDNPVLYVRCRTGRAPPDPLAPPPSTHTHTPT